VISVVHQRTFKPTVLLRAVRFTVVALLFPSTFTVGPRRSGSAGESIRKSWDWCGGQTRVFPDCAGRSGLHVFGSQYGLNRYDGYKFKVFKHEPGNRNSLSGVFIYSLFKDRSGSLWMDARSS